MHECKKLAHQSHECNALTDPLNLSVLALPTCIPIFNLLFIFSIALITYILTILSIENELVIYLVLLVYLSRSTSVSVSSFPHCQL